MICTICHGVGWIRKHKYSTAYKAWLPKHMREPEQYDQAEEFIDTICPSCKGLGERVSSVNHK